MLRFFDCEMGVGATGLSYPATPTPEDALAVMDRYGIESALVYDRGTHESGVFDRFDFLLDYCGRSPRLVPTIPVLPPATGEQPTPKKLVGFCLANGIRVVRACPVAHNYVCDRHSMGQLLAELQEHRMPLVHTSMQVEDHPWLHAPPWQDIRDVALAFPRLPIIVIYTGMLQGRSLFPLFAQCPNVLADLNCVSFNYIEAVVERFGSGRLVFASPFPTEDPALYTTGVAYCGVSEEARRNIAGDNIRRLLEDVR